MEQAFGEIWPGYKARLLAADLAAYLAMARDSPSLEDMLPAIEIPCLLYAGESDPRPAAAERAARAIPQATYFGCRICGTWAPRPAAISCCPA